MNRGLFGVCTLGFVAATSGCEYIAPLFDKGADTGNWTGTTAPGTDVCCSYTGTYTLPGTMPGITTTGFSVDITWSTGQGVSQLDTAAADTSTPPAPTCPGQVDILIDDPLGFTSFNFGMVDAGSTSAWTGEDCISAPSLCHPIGPEHTLVTVADCDPTSAVAGSTTAFALSDAPLLTYYLDDGSVAFCWVWGADPSYYTALGCAPL